MSIPTWAKMGLVGAGSAGIAGAIYIPEDRSDQNKNNVLSSAAIAGLAGGAVGASIVPAYEGMIDIGKNGINIAKKGYDKLSQPGAIEKILDENADSILTGAKKAMGVGIGVASVPVGLSKTISDTFIDEVDDEAGSLINAKFNKKGKLLMAGIAFMNAVNEGFNAYNESRKGVSTRRMLTPTPSFIEEQRQVQENRSMINAEAYGAGGDLVFALNRNRQG